MTGIGFYKNEDNVLLYAPSFVAAPNYTLEIALKDTYAYPVDGWILCANEREAKYLLNITEIEEAEIIE